MRCSQLVTSLEFLLQRRSDRGLRLHLGLPRTLTTPVQPSRLQQDSQPGSDNVSGIIESISLSPRHGETQHAIEQATLTADLGLEGDRYAGDGVVSLIEAEAVQRFNAATGLNIEPAQTGRNLVTQGVALNRLVGKRFQIGGVLVEGVELCEPCATLGGRLSTGTVSAREIVRAFLNSGGLRARVLTSGKVIPGTPVIVC